MIIEIQNFAVMNKRNWVRIFENFKVFFAILTDLFFMCLCFIIFYSILSVRYITVPCMRYCYYTSLLLYCKIHYKACMALFSQTCLMHLANWYSLNNMNIFPLILLISERSGEPFHLANFSYYFESSKFYYRQPCQSQILRD